MQAHTISDVMRVLNLSLGQPISNPSDLALKLVYWSILQKGGPFGTVICDHNHHLLGVGTNHVTLNHDPTEHGEIYAIRHAIENGNEAKLKGARLFTSCEACPMCDALARYHNLEIHYSATQHDADSAGFSDEEQWRYLEHIKEPHQATQWIKRCSWHDQSIEIDSTTPERYSRPNNPEESPLVQLIRAQSKALKRPEHPNVILTNPDPDQQIQLMNYEWTVLLWAKITMGDGFIREKAYEKAMKMKGSSARQKIAQQLFELFNSVSEQEPSMKYGQKKDK